MPCVNRKSDLLIKVDHFGDSGRATFGVEDIVSLGFAFAPMDQGILR